MSRLSKTLVNIGAIFLLSCLPLVMTFSILLISSTSFIEGGYDQLHKFGQFLRELTGEVLSSMKTLGSLLFVLCLIILSFIIIFLVFVNSQKAITQRVGYLLGIIGSAILFLVSLSIFSATATSASDGSKILLSGLGLIFFGIAGLIILVGSILGMICAKTNK